MLEIAFFVLATVAIGSAFGVVLGRSPVASLLFMVATLASVAGIYVLLEAHFLAAIQVIVYAGAIMVLFMFVIMLLNLGHEYQQDLKSVAWTVTSFVLSGVMVGLLASRFWSAGDDPFFQFFDGADAIDAALLEKGAVGVIAEPLFTTWVVAFEITGILLLVAIVGALVLAKKRVTEGG